MNHHLDLRGTVTTNSGAGLHGLLLELQVDELAVCHPSQPGVVKLATYEPAVRWLPWSDLLSILRHCGQADLSKLIPSPTKNPTLTLDALNAVAILGRVDWSSATGDA